MLCNAYELITKQYTVNEGMGADLGQGVNAALLDVLTLSECMEEAQGDLHGALHKYEDVRVAESAALVRMMQVRTLPHHRLKGMMCLTKRA